MPKGIYIRKRKLTPPSQLGKHWKLSEGAKLNIGKAQKGNIKGKGNRGKHHTEETKDKLRKAAKKRIGNKSPNWQNGISFEPYPTDWTKTLKRAIRERDHYACQLCGELQGDIAFDVHHIDYDKENCNPDNLITLCKSCHIKTNFNRKYWTEYFKERRKQ